MDVEHAAARLAALLVAMGRQLNEAATGQGLTPAEFAVLDTVREQGQRDVTTLADVEHVHPYMLNRTLRDLARNDLVALPPDTADMRNAPIGTTPMGKLVHGRISDRRYFMLIHAVDKIPPEDVDAVPSLIALLEALANALGAEPDDGQ